MAEKKTTARTKKPSAAKTSAKQRQADQLIVKEIISIICIAISILVIISVFKPESVGFFGHIINGVFCGLFGIGAYFGPFIMIGISIFIIFNKKKEVAASKIVMGIALFVIFISFTHILSLDETFTYNGGIDYIKRNYIDGQLRNGGLVGAVFGNFFLQILGRVGSYVLMGTSALVLAIVLTGRSFFDAIADSYENVREKIAERGDMYDVEYMDDYDEDETEYEREMKKPVKDRKSIDFVMDEEKRGKKGAKILLPEDEDKKKKLKSALDIQFKAPFDDVIVTGDREEEYIDISDFPIDIKGIGIDKAETISYDSDIPEIRIIEQPHKTYIEPASTYVPEPKLTKKESAQAEKEKIIAEITEAVSESTEGREYQFPPESLLNPDPGVGTGSSKAQILENSKKLEDTLKSFGVEAKVIEVSVGPTVTRYELFPGPGVKVSKISNLADDLALNLAANGIRIEAPIPGKAAVGIEVPNKETQIVYFRDIIDDETFKKFPSKLAFGLGKDIAGKTVVSDIAKMPHLLIAGATGAGKSVCINTLIASLLYKSNPDEVKLIMVDPKVVELSVYNGIPHLLIPVVTDPKKASGALNWAVREMLRRYDLFALTGVRDLKGYNMLVDKGEDMVKEPHIVIIIDELADLMMAAPGEVEDSICRLAQMARAAGLHLIIATQRPSVDVITGVIKANIPSRLAFSVSSGIDSRTILDMVGAEKLLGRGDMLFSPIGTNKPIRIQGAFISDKEVEAIVNFLKADAEHEYSQEMIDTITSTTKGVELNEDTDEFFEPAVEFIIQKEKASASMLQRQFRIGYNRASRLIEDLETRGIVGPEDGSKPRKVLMTSYMWQEMKAGPKPDDDFVEEQID